MLRLKAKELSSDPEFKASLGWYTNWRRHHAISMRTKTSLAQRLPADMEEKAEFHWFVLRAQRCCDYDFSRILNMDETPMRFELPATRTLEFRGSQTVPIVSCRGDKQSFIVVLAVKANGEKLPPKVVFKGVLESRIQVPPRMQVAVRKKGWMDEDGLFWNFFIFLACFEQHICVVSLLHQSYHISNSKERALCAFEHVHQNMTVYLCSSIFRNLSELYNCKFRFFSLIVVCL